MSNKFYTGKLITFEGSDGAGKSTQLRMLADEIKQRTGETPVCLREPGSSPIGEEIRKIFKDPELSKNITPETELFLIQAARTQMVQEVMLPALIEGKTVLCDRYIHSTVFYQGYGRGIDPNIITATTLAATGGISPDLVILLVLPRDEALKRMNLRKIKDGEITAEFKADRLDEEKEAFFEAVQKGVDDFSKANSPKIAPINANQSASSVAADVNRALEKAGIFSISLATSILTPSTAGKLILP